MGIPMLTQKQDSPNVKTIDTAVDVQEGTGTPWAAFLKDLGERLQEHLRQTREHQEVVYERNLQAAASAVRECQTLRSLLAEVGTNGVSSSLRLDRYATDCDRTLAEAPE